MGQNKISKLEMRIKALMFTELIKQGTWDLEAAAQAVLRCYALLFNTVYDFTIGTGANVKEQPKVKETGDEPVVVARGRYFNTVQSVPRSATSWEMLRSYERECSFLKDKLREKGMRIKELTDLVSHRLDTINSLVSQIDEEKEKLSTCEKELESSEKLRKESATQMEVLESIIKEREAYNRTLNARIDALEKKEKELSGWLETGKRSRELIQKSLQEAELSNGRLSSQVNNQKLTIRDQRHTIEELETQLKIMSTIEYHGESDSPLKGMDKQAPSEAMVKPEDVTPDAFYRTFNINPQTPTVERNSRDETVKPEDFEFDNPDLAENTGLAESTDFPYGDQNPTPSAVYKEPKESEDLPDPDMKPKKPTPQARMKKAR